LITSIARARFGSRRVLHLVEGRGHAGLLQPLVYETQELELLACEHRDLPQLRERFCFDDRSMKLWRLIDGD
jgi:hypothetical protein